MCAYRIRSCSVTSLTPQPDIGIVRYVEDFHETAHRRAEDVMLVAEIADSSMRVDLEWKAWLYAAAGVPEYWIVDLAHERVVVHTVPGSQGYTSIRSLSGAQTLSAAALADSQWTVDDVLGAPRRL